MGGIEPHMAALLPDQAQTALMQITD